MRLFVALPLPDDLRARLAGMAGGVPNARWVAPENLHLTLRFIGEADGAQARDVDAALTRISVPAFSLSLAGVDHFGAGEKVRSLWAGVDESAELSRLHGKIEHALQQAGLPPEGRKFKAHVTLARFKRNPGAKLYTFLAHHALFRGTPFAVREFVLYSSFLSHNGAIYSPEASYALRPAKA
jgi:2'-5' RNA ligase